MKTSKELSEKLKKAGFEKDSEFYWVDRLLDRTESNETAEIILWADVISEWEPNGEIIAPAYDILNDLCCKYAKEVFQPIMEGNDFRAYSIMRKITNHILFMLQQNKPQKEIEDYLVANSILK